MEPTTQYLEIGNEGRVSIDMSAADPPLGFPVAPGHQVATRDPSATSTATYDPMAAAKALFDVKTTSSMFNQSGLPPLMLQFTDLEYSIERKDKSSRKILKGITGEARPGQVLAIMGSSGAGKTTLLNLLAGRLESANNSSWAGQITVNGKPRNFESFRQQSAYVLQADTLYANLTVRETIAFSAACRLPASVSAAEKTERVEAVIMELGLSLCADTLVGDELIRGVSGGERKRVNIACELVSNPSVLFLDEPTTGLDSFNAQSTMVTLSRLARNGRTIVTVIHQPRSSIFAMFDQLLLIADGKIMYFGVSNSIVPHLASCGYPCPAGFNPADFFIDLVSLDTRSKDLSEDALKRVDHLALEYTKHAGKVPDAPGMPHNLQKISSEQGHKYATSWFRQLVLLSGREAKLVRRDKAGNGALIGQTIIFSIILGLIWLNEGRHLGGTHVQAIAGALFFICVNQAFGSMFGIIFLFPSERAIVLKERAARTYHVGAYFLSKSVVELPRTVLAALLFAGVTYPMVWLRSSGESFILYWVILIMVASAAQGIAYVVSALASTPQAAGAIAPVLIVNSMLFGGFFIGTDAIPIFLSWLRYLSFLKYAFAVIMQNQFEGLVLDTNNCEDPNFCLATGDDALKLYGVDELPKWANFVILLGMIVGLRVIAYLILLRRGPAFLAV